MNREARTELLERLSSVLMFETYQQLCKLNDYIDTLEAALRFYANPNYNDSGRHAREALDRGSNEN